MLLVEGFPLRVQAHQVRAGSRSAGEPGERLPHSRRRRVRAGRAAAPQSRAGADRPRRPICSSTTWSFSATWPAATSGPAATPPRAGCRTSCSSSPSAAAAWWCSAGQTCFPPAATRTATLAEVPFDRASNRHGEPQFEQVLRQHSQAGLRPSRSCGCCPSRSRTGQRLDRACNSSTAPTTSAVQAAGHAVNDAPGPGAERARSSSATPVMGMICGRRRQGAGGVGGPLWRWQLPTGVRRSAADDVTGHHGRCLALPPGPASRGCPT